MQRYAWHAEVPQVLIYWNKKVKQHRSHIRIFITDIYVEIYTNLNRFFAVNLIILLSNTKYCKFSCVWSAVPVTKCFTKRYNVNILNDIQVYRRRFWAVLVDFHVQEAVPRCYTKRVCCKKCHPSWCDLKLNIPSVELVFYLSACSRAVSSQLFLHETVYYSVSNCFMKIKMKSNIIKVETSFRHDIYSAAFVSGRLLRFHIPKFHLVPVTCWCLLPRDLVNTS